MPEATGRSRFFVLPINYRSDENGFGGRAGGRRDNQIGWGDANFAARRNTGKRRWVCNPAGLMKGILKGKKKVAGMGVSTTDRLGHCH